MATPLVIIGMGGFGREVHDLIEDINSDVAPQREHFEVLGFFDDAAFAEGERRPRGLTHLGRVSELIRLPRTVSYVIAIGNGAVRRRIDKVALTAGLEAATLVHPSAVVGRHHVELGPGCIVAAMSTITTNVKLGRHVHLNMGVTVGHDVACRDYVTVSPNASISGNVVLEEEVLVGTGAVIIQDRRVGARSVVGAGSAVMHNLPGDVTAIGVPARPFPGRVASGG